MMRLYRVTSEREDYVLATSTAHAEQIAQQRRSRAASSSVDAEEVSSLADVPCCEDVSVWDGHRTRPLLDAAAVVGIKEAV